MTTLEIEPSDVIRLIEQYLKESSLHRTLQALQEETSISLNVVDSVESFVQDINSGHWDIVLKIVRSLNLPDNKLIDLYEQIAIELIELRELGAARSLIRTTNPMTKLKSLYPERYIHLENLLGLSYFESREAYRDGGSREKRRSAIAMSLKNEVSVVPPSRLLTLLNDAMKWQKHEGALQPGLSINLFTGRTIVKQIEAETFPTKLHNHCIKARPCETGDDKVLAVFCCKFSPDGHYLVTGWSNGFIEVYNATTGKLARDLKYQAQNALMRMPGEAVFCLCFSASEMLASGDSDGEIIVWRLQTGQCIKRFNKAHVKGVSCIAFNRDNTQVLSGSFDTTIRIHGMKSGRLLREFRGHTSYVNDLTYSSDGNYIVSGSSDGSVKVWNFKTTECINTTKIGLADVRVHTVRLLPHFRDQKDDLFLIGTKSDELIVMNIEGQEVKKVQIEGVEKGGLITCCSSPRGEWLYAIDDKKIFCIKYDENTITHSIEVHDEGTLGLCHHPCLNRIVTFDGIGNLKIWKP